MNKPVRNSHNFFIVTLINFPSILFFIAHAISKSKHKKLQICEKKFHCGRLWKLRQIKNRKAKALIGIKRSLLRGETITITCEKLVFFLLIRLLLSFDNDQDHTSVHSTSGDAGRSSTFSTSICWYIFFREWRHEKMKVCKTSLAKIFPDMRDGIIDFGREKGTEERNVGQFSN